MDEETPENKARRTLWESIVTGKQVITKKLLDQIKIPINEPLTPIGTSPLHQAILSGRDALAKEFIEQYHADVNIQDQNLRRPLHFAAACGNIDIMNYLVNRGADGGETPAMKACTAGEERCLNELVFTHKCNIQLKNSCGKSVLDLLPLYLGKEKRDRFLANLYTAGIVHPSIDQNLTGKDFEGNMDVEEEKKDGDVVNNATQHQMGYFKFLNNK